MKTTIAIFIGLLMVAGNVAAQDFITRGKIEYEVKVNNKKLYSDEDRARSSWLANLPEFDISYRDLTFAWNNSIYTPGRKGNQFRQQGEFMIYANLDEQRTVVKRELFQDYFVYNDSVRTVKWRIQDETRKIAGFECRKAVGVFNDSIYVVAFYCPEVIPQGGPEFFSGLPGMILGLAIPRFNTTWFATKIEIAGIDESKIIPPSPKKGKTLGMKELTDIIYKKWKDSGWWKDATPEKVYNSLKIYTL